MTGLYEAIRQRVTARQAAEVYGLRFNRTGRALCPWHDDHKPDLAFYGERCYCHACHSSGDAIALTAQLFNLSMREAALRLNADFQLGLDADAPQMVTEPTETRLRQRQRESDRKIWGTLCEIVREADRRLQVFHDGSAWDNPGFRSVLEARSRASMSLDNMWAEVLERGRAG